MMKNMMTRLSNKLKTDQQSNHSVKTLELEKNKEPVESPDLFQFGHRESREGQNDNFFNGKFFDSWKLNSNDHLTDSISLPFLKKISRQQSKVQSTAQQQSIKRYKEILHEFYNLDYINNYNKSLGELWYSGSFGNQNSQEFKKPRFKAYRLKLAQKEKQRKPINQKKNYEQYLMRFIESSKICLYQMKNAKIQQIKPIFVNVKEEMSENIEYDTVSSRIFCFSNIKQEVVVLSVKLNEIICRVKIKHKRINPEMLLHHYKGKEFLLVIGGYEKRGSLVEGSKFIEVFLVDKWEISLHQKIIKLNIGRIYPIVFSYELNQEPSIFIIGGNSNAKFSQKLDFKNDEDINFSINQTGVRILSSQIYDTFFGKEEDNFILVNNLNIRFEETLNLYNGCVLVRRQMNENYRLELFLSNTAQVMDLKIIKNEINIINSKFKMDYKSNDRLGLKIGYYKTNDNHGYELFRLDKKGKLIVVNMSVNQQKDEKDGTGCTIM